jgi:hypothetical protein
LALILLFPLSLSAQQDIDWFKFPSAEYPYPAGTTGFQIRVIPHTENVDMEVQKKFRSSSGNWITGTVFPAFFSRPDLQVEVFSVNNVNVADTFFIRLFSPHILDSCADYTLKVITFPYVSE